MRASPPAPDVVPADLRLLAPFGRSAVEGEFGLFTRAGAVCSAAMFAARGLQPGVVRPDMRREVLIGGTVLDVQQHAPDEVGREPARKHDDQHRHAQEARQHDDAMRRFGFRKRVVRDAVAGSVTGERLTLVEVYRLEPGADSPSAA